MDIISIFSDIFSNILENEVEHCKVECYILINAKYIAKLGLY